MAEQASALGPVDFSTHVLSLASTVLIALGKMPGPDGESHPQDLETARHLIDVLGMLEQKTKGNLDEAETKLLASLIYDLRVAYVDAQNAHDGGQMARLSAVVLVVGVLGGCRERLSGDDVPPGAAAAPALTAAAS